MSHANTFDAYDAANVPPVVDRYMVAHGDGDASRQESVVEAFAPDAQVTDEGIRYEGRDAIRSWVNKTGSQYTYTTTLAGQRQDGPEQWTVLGNLEGDFPGGTVDLLYRFTLRGDKISQLIIAP